MPVEQLNLQPEHQANPNAVSSVSSVVGVESDDPTPHVNRWKRTQLLTYFAPPGLLNQTQNGLLAE